MLAQRTRNKHKKIIRREQAEVRNEERNKRSILEQITVLDGRLGKNIGAVKERVRLFAKQRNNELAA